MYPLQQASRGSDRLAVPEVSVPKMVLVLQRTFLLTIKLRVGWDTGAPCGLCNVGSQLQARTLLWMERLQFMTLKTGFFRLIAPWTYLLWQIVTDQPRLLCPPQKWVIPLLYTGMLLNTSSHIWGSCVWCLDQTQQLIKPNPALLEKCHCRFQSLPLLFCQQIFMTHRDIGSL